MYYNLQKAADTLGLSSGDVNRLREQGKLRAFRDGADWKFRKEDVDKYLANMIKERSGANAESAAPDAPQVSSDDFDSMFDRGEEYLSAPGAPDSFIDATEDVKEILTEKSAVEPELALVDSDEATDVGLEPVVEEEGVALDKSDDDLGGVALNKSDDDLALASEGSDDLTFAVDDSASGLKLAKDDDQQDDLQIADEPTVASIDDDLRLVDEPTTPSVDDLISSPDSPLTDESSALVDEPEAKPSVDGLSMGSDSGLSLVEDLDDFDLNTEPSASGSTPLTSEDSALVDSESVDNASSVDLAADVPSTGSSSDNVVNTSNSDSGLSLLDDLTGGSNVDLGGDFVLGGSGSGSGSGSSLNLTGSDSGLALLGDSDAGFELDAAVDEESKVASSDDGGVYGLAPTESVGAVLNLDKDADEEGATEFAANDDSVFDLVDDSVSGASTSGESSAIVGDPSDISSDSESNPFFTDDSEESNAADGSSPDDSLFTLDEPSATSTDDDGSISLDISQDAGDSQASDSASDPFHVESADNSFGSADLSGLSGFGAASGASSPFSGSATNSFGGGTDVFGASSSSSSENSFGAGAAAFGAAFDDTEAAPQGLGNAPAPAVSSMNFTGKDLLFLVPCLIFLILATIGAVELCRTIWSYEEGTGDIAGPLLESIAKLFK